MSHPVVNGLLPGQQQHRARPRVFSSPVAAENQAIGVARSVQDTLGGEVVDEGLLSSDDGSSIRYVQLVDSNGAEWVLWSNGRLYALVVGPPGDAVDFFLALDY